MFARKAYPLAPERYPVTLALEIQHLDEAAMPAENELGMHALADRDRCCGYFPALAGAGILSDLPACAAFADRLPHIAYAGLAYRFNFLRLSLVQQSAEPAYHLDSDADTAVTGEAASLSRRRVLRLLLNLSTRSERTLHYLDVDPCSVELAVDGSYVRAANPGALHRHARLATVSRRRGTLVHGLAFASNLVLHSGVDDPHGHFVAAYGIELDACAGAESKAHAPNADKTRSRSARWPATANALSPKTR